MREPHTATSASNISPVKGENTRPPSDKEARLLETQGHSAALFTFAHIH